MRVSAGSHRASAIGSPPTGLGRHGLDMSEGASGVPGGEGSREPGWAVELDALIACGLRPGELAGVPLDEGLGFGRDVEILVEAGVLLADLRIPVLDQEPVPLVAPAAGEVESDHNASIRESVRTDSVAHRPQRDEGIEMIGGDIEPERTTPAAHVADRIRDVTNWR